MGQVEFDVRWPQRAISFERRIAMTGKVSINVHKGLIGDPEKTEALATALFILKELLAYGFRQAVAPHVYCPNYRISWADFFNPNTLNGKNLLVCYAMAHRLAVNIVPCSHTARVEMTISFFTRGKKEKFAILHIVAGLNTQDSNAMLVAFPTSSHPCRCHSGQ